MLLNEIINEFGMTKGGSWVFKKKDCCQWIKITMVIVTILHKMLKL